jgi:GNAT superfamily N-acetyltransferase
MRWARLKERIASLAHTPRLLLAQKLLRRVPLRPIDVGQLCFLQLNGLPTVPPAMLRGQADVRLATPADLPGLVRLQNKTDMFRERFAQGDRCVVAMIDDQLVGYEWFSENPFHHEAAWGYRITIPGGFVYAYDAYIEPAHRNTGVWLRFKAYLAEWMAARGKQGVLTFVDYGNWPSLRTHLRFGFRPTESVVALRVIGVRLFRKARAVGATTWSTLVWLLMHPAGLPLHHAAARGLHVALAIVRR